MVMWPVTSLDPERSRSWPRYIWKQLSQRLLDIEAWFQWDTNRKWHIDNRIIIWSMTSCDLVRLSSWPQYVGAHYLKRYRLDYNRTFIGNGTWVSDGHVTSDVTWPERLRSWHQYAWADYLENGWRNTLSYDFTWPWRSRSSRCIWIEISWRVLETFLDKLHVLWTLSCLE